MRAVAAGEIISHYRLGRKLGRGGMGVVYEAEDLKLHRPVALKFLPQEVGADPVALARFEREAQAASALNHPNVCTIYEIDTADGQPFIAMELLDGATLTHKIGGKPLEQGLLIDFAIQMTDALEAAHAAGIVHRDLKPDNVFVASRGQLKVLDFGLAKIMGGPGDNAFTAFTAPGSTVGTVAYMSPEQVLGKELDARTDLFSLGVVLYEMGTGRLPFHGESTGAVMDAILHQTPTPPLRLNPELSPKLSEIIVKALEKDRDLRYQHATDVRSDLKRIKRDSDSALPIAALASSPLPRRARRRAHVGVLATVLLALVVAAVFYSRRSHALTEKDTVVLTDFANSTGDPAFDETLKQALVVQLGQSPFLNILSDARERETLRLMGRPEDSRVNVPMARDICQRTRSAAVLSGSIASLGSQYVLGLNALDCRTGDTVAVEQAQASSKEKVLGALDGAAGKLRAKLGESLSSIHKFDTPVEQATTSSLEALKAFSLGLQARQNKNESEALPLFRRAVELDPNFAMAYGALGTAYGNLGEEDLARENIQKAYDLRGHASEREKFRIVTYYHVVVTGDLNEMLHTCQEWVLAYPGDWLAHGLLSNALEFLGRHEQALEEGKTALQFNPDMPFVEGQVAEYEMALGRIQDAEAMIRDALNRHPDTSTLHVAAYNIAFLRGDSDGMQRQVQWAATHPGEGAFLVAEQARTEAYAGHLHRAAELSGQAVGQLRASGVPRIASLMRLCQAHYEVEAGNSERARRQAAAVLSEPANSGRQLLGALILVRAGDTGRAQLLAQQARSRFTQDTFVQQYWSPTIDAAIEIRRGNPGRAIQLLESAIPLELGDSGGGVYLYPAYLRGEAYLLLHRGAEAALEFQKLIDHRGLVQNDLLGVLAYLGLGRAYALQGDARKARAAYDQFFTLWKDADPDLPVLRQARLEYTQLKSRH